MNILKPTIIISCLLIAALVVSTASGQTRHKLVKEGNRLYAEGKYDEAIARYRLAETRGALPQIDFNLGDAHYKSGNLERAAEVYFKTLNDSDTVLRANALHNLGNAFFDSGEYDKSVGAYINSLRLNPSDIETKQNLEYVRRMLQQQQQQQKQDGDEKKKGDSQDQQQQQQNQKQQEEQDQQDQQQQQDQSEQNQTEQQQAEPQKLEMSKEDALKILNALQNDEKAVQKKVLRKQFVGRKSKGKKW